MPHGRFCICLLSAFISCVTVAALFSDVLIFSVCHGVCQTIVLFRLVNRRSLIDV